MVGIPPVPQVDTTSIVNPGFSSSAKPGYVPNTSVQGHNAWREAALDILATQWATTPVDQRGSFMQPYWAVGSVNGASKYGNLDMNDGVDANGTIYTHPATMAGLSRYLADYQPGSNAQLESIIPYVAPQANEYIESPDAVALRVAQQNADRNYALNLAQEDRIRWQTQLQADLQRQSNAASSASAAASRAASERNAAAAAAATRYAADQAAGASRYGTQGQFASSIYGTDAGMWDSQNRNQISALTAGGNLGLGLQGIYDTRTSDIIRNKSNPADFVERVSSVRALSAPEGSDVTAYRDVPGISQAMNQLLTWQPTTKPTAPTLPGFAHGTQDGWVSDDKFISGDPQRGNMANPELVESRVRNGEVQHRITPISGAMSGVRQFNTGSYKTFSPNASGGGMEEPFDYSGEGPSPVDALPGSSGGQSTYQLPNAYKSYQNIGWDEWYKSPFASQSINAANNPWGSQSVYFDPTTSKTIRVDPLTGQINTLYGGVQLGAPSSNVGRGSFSPTPRERTVNPLSTPRPDGGRRPENAVVPTVPAANSNTGPAATTPTQPTNNAGNPTTPVGQQTTPNPLGQTDQLTNILNTISTAFTSIFGQNNSNGGAATNAPNTIFKDYTDAQIQQLPFLQYLFGGMPASQFNGISTVMSPGPFGTQIGDPGALNLRKLWEVSQDPDSLAMLDSIYRGANRNLSGSAAMAAQRAPTGQAIPISAVMT